jgi:hypothetical protein
MYFVQFHVIYFTCSNLFLSHKIFLYTLSIYTIYQSFLIYAFTTYTVHTQVYLEVLENELSSEWRLFTEFAGETEAITRELRLHSKFKFILPTSQMILMVLAYY